MMRPTAASAGKAHEKVEVRSPPRKTATGKPKRKSEGHEQERRKSEGAGVEPVKKEEDVVVEEEADEYVFTGSAVCGKGLMAREGMEM